MNQQIKLLADQTGFRDDDGEWHFSDDSDVEKFALLIIKECMNAVGNGPMERASIQAIKAAFGVEYYEPIEKAFGVEE